MYRAGRYFVFDEIASGGMGSVHLGRLVGAAGFGRLVAVKCLHPHLQKEPEFIAMLLDEARLASRVYHPNVVQVLDVITERMPLLVLEYVHGESLARLVKHQRGRNEALEPSIAAAILVGVLRGLHAAHETKADDGSALGIVHRDVSPHNVLVNVEGVPKLIDFGIAKAQGRLQTTRDGQLKGKMAYMSPEQLQGEPIDRRADIYAASIILWELVTGERLFVSESDGATVTKILRGTVERPSSIASNISAALDAIVLRGLAHDALARYQTASDMADALETECPLAPASRVAEWVTREWPDAETRVRRLAEIEQVRIGSAGGEETESAIVTVPRPPPRSARGRPPDGTDFFLRDNRNRSSRRLGAWSVVLAVPAAALLAILSPRSARRNGPPATHTAAGKPPLGASPVASAAVPPRRDLVVDPSEAIVTVEGRNVTNASGHVELQGEPGDAFDVTLALGTVQSTSRVYVTRDGRLEPARIALNPAQDSARVRSPATKRVPTFPATVRTTETAEAKAASTVTTPSPAAVKPREVW